MNVSLCQHVQSLVNINFYVSKKEHTLFPDNMFEIKIQKYNFHRTMKITL